MKKTKVIKTTKDEYFCDICGKRRYISCSECGRDVCKEHTITIVPDYGDYNNYYCTECYEIMTPFIYIKNGLQSDIDENNNKKDEALNKFHKTLEVKK